MTELRVADVDSPVGAIRMVFRDDAVCALSWVDHWEVTRAGLTKRFGELELVAANERGGPLSRYVDGELDALDELEVDLGGTEFQRRVWNALREIPVGTTWTYGELARHIGSPKAAQAVGAANGQNPCWIALPCHRVLGADGALVGYAGGLERKRWLLQHEGALLV